jgi:NAD+ kinase
MDRIGILCHPGRSDSSRYALQVQDLLQGRGLSVWQGSADDEVELRRAASQLDLLITLGGDGTIVRAVRALAVAGVPVLGVNLGRLGFLAEIEPAQIPQAISALLAGQYTVEERMMLHGELYREALMINSAEAINDLVMARGSGSRTVRISVDVDDHYVMTQTADGMIVSTPTGSTAYCLSAGGPIVAPDLDSITLTPVAAHLSVAHAIVVPACRCVRLRLIKGQGTMVTVDGQSDMAIEPGDELRCTASEHKARFVRFGNDGYFYETVLRRLRWPDQGPIS